MEKNKMTQQQTTTANYDSKLRQQTTTANQ